MENLMRSFFSTRGLRNLLAALLWLAFALPAAAQPPGTSRIVGLSDLAGQDQALSLRLGLADSLVVKLAGLADPDFGGTLLGLLGVSGASYVGLKFPKAT